MTSHPTVTFSKYVNIHENVDIDKSVDLHTHVFGTLGMANATADAIGSNTMSETLTETHAVQGYGSSASSESVSATSGFHYSIW